MLCGTDAFGKADEEIRGGKRCQVPSRPVVSGLRVGRQAPRPRTARVRQQPRDWKRGRRKNFAWPRCRCGPVIGRAWGLPCRAAATVRRKTAAAGAFSVANLIV